MWQCSIEWRGSVAEWRGRPRGVLREQLISSLVSLLSSSSGIGRWREDDHEQSPNWFRPSDCGLPPPARPTVLLCPNAKVYFVRSYKAKLWHGSTHSSTAAATAHLPNDGSHTMVTNIFRRNDLSVCMCAAKMLFWWHRTTFARWNSAVCLRSSVTTCCCSRLLVMASMAQGHLNLIPTLLSQPMVATTHRGHIIWTDFYVKTISFA